MGRAIAGGTVWSQIMDKSVLKEQRATTTVRTMSKPHLLRLTRHCTGVSLELFVAFMVERT